MRADARLRRQKILQAAAELFRHRHPADVSLEEIAQSAGVGIATLYRNFPDRATLMVECAAYLVSGAIELLDSYRERFAADPARLWPELIWRLVDLGIGPLVPALAPDTLAELPPHVQQLREKVTDSWHDLFLQAQRAGVAPRDWTSAQFMAGLMVITRPPIPGVAEISPTVTRDLVGAYLRAPE